MRIRIKFTKNESVKYLGHLDIMRTFQRSFNRAGIQMEYSEGFNPHQKMHLARPLGVGVLSRGEYLDAQIKDGQDSAVIRTKLDQVTGEGFTVLAVRRLAEDAAKAMASVRYASYDILTEEDYGLDLAAYEAQISILISKKTKTGIREVDVKDLLMNLQKDGSLLHVQMKAGSENNLKPELLMEDILRFHRLAFKEDMLQITRTELYAEGTVPLIEYQTI